jgi:hypothetical protein
MGTTLTYSATGIQGAMMEYKTRFREDVMPVLTPTMEVFQKFKQGGARNFLWTGRGAVFDCVLGDPVGWNHSDAGYLPDSNWRGEAQGKVDIKRGYVRQKFDRLMIAALKGGSGSFITFGQKLDEEYRIKFRLLLQEAIHGDGRGILAKVSVVTDSTHVKVVDPYGLSGGGQGGLWLMANRRVSVRAPAGTVRTWAASANNGLITSVALDAGSTDTYVVTLAATNSNIQVGDFFVGATTNDDAWNGTPNGLINMTNVGGNFATLHNLSGASNATPGGSPNGGPRHNTRRLVASSNQTARPDQLTDSDLYDLALRIAAWSGINPCMVPDEYVIITTPGLKKGYKESRVGYVHLTQQEGKKTAGGWGYDAEWNGIPIIDDPYCPVGTLYMLHKPSLGWVDAEDWGVVAMDGMDEFRPVTDQDAFEKAMGIYYNFATTRRNAHGVISGYTENVRYTWID